jgi:hypothetical protein
MKTLCTIIYYSTRAYAKCICIQRKYKMIFRVLRTAELEYEIFKAYEFVRETS